jgi:hypothetical protein
MKHPISRFSTEIFASAMFSEVQYLAPLRYDEYNTEHNVTTQMHKLGGKKRFVRWGNCEGVSFPLPYLFVRMLIEMFSLCLDLIRSCLYPAMPHEELCKPLTGWGQDTAVWLWKKPLMDDFLVALCGVLFFDASKW